MQAPETRTIRKSTRLARWEVQLFLRLMAEDGTSNESDYWRVLLHEKARQRDWSRQFLADHGCAPADD